MKVDNFSIQHILFEVLATGNLFSLYTLDVFLNKKATRYTDGSLFCMYLFLIFYYLF